MAGSYRKINYQLRPAKSIERKMLVEAFRKLNEFGAVEAYRYIGFGSTYFTDFSYVHKSLNISNMISIEHYVSDKDRFEFNKPFSCIEMEYGDSNSVLPRLRWDSIRTILWLDYDGPLDRSVLTDIDFFCTKACPGSMLIVSVNAEPAKLQTDNGITQKPDRLGELKKLIGEDKVPLDVREADLTQWGKAKVLSSVIINEITEQLMTRNGGLPAGSKIVFKQFVNFNYSDGAKMLTLGGIIYDEGQESIISKCGFDKLHFARSLGQEPFRIEIPNLTHKEIRHLDAQMPVSLVDIAMLSANGIPLEDLRKFIALYRYFPAFVEIDM